jgi:hypothetical protein
LQIRASASRQEAQLPLKRVAVIGLLLAGVAVVGSQLTGASAVTQPVEFPTEPTWS